MRTGEKLQRVIRTAQRYGVGVRIGSYYEHHVEHDSGKPTTCFTPSAEQGAGICIATDPMVIWIDTVRITSDDHRAAWIVTHELAHAIDEAPMPADADELRGPMLAFEYALGRQIRLKGRTPWMSLFQVAGTNWPSLTVQEKHVYLETSKRAAIRTGILRSDGTLSYQHPAKRLQRLSGQQHYVRPYGLAPTIIL